MIQTNPAAAAEADAPVPSGRLLRLPRTLDRVGLQRTAWLELVRQGKAPKPIKIGRATLWLESEVQQFISDRVRQHRGA